MQGLRSSLILPFSSLFLLHSKHKRQVMVVLIIISLLTCIFAGAENAPSIYQRHDINQTRGNLNKLTKITSYIGASGADSEQYFESLAKVLSVFEEDNSLEINPCIFICMFVCRM